jgi:UDP-N-acetylglucosamine--N-acetylmuramyl-(pentapeptide) pyrophosphoryl-undecaprenol N-acetylglucosamine transferase
MLKTVLIMAGGTGGHVFPALAVAKKLQQSNITIKWLGTKQGLEKKIVPEAGIKLYTISAVGLRGKRISNLIKAPFLLGMAFFKTLCIFIKIKPDVVLGMGGFVSGIGGIVAWIFSVPLIIHEQNSVAGTTNKLLNKFATQSLQAFDGALKNAITCGNPVNFIPQLKINTKKNNVLNLLVLGGSLGAQPINKIIDKLTLDINIWHQTGQHYTPGNAIALHKKTTVFIQDMSSAYAWADIVVSRAGAMSLSEIMLCGLPSILIPLPHATDNHQFFNAKILENHGASILINQNDLTVKLLEKTLLGLNQQQLSKMAKSALKIAKPQASNEVCKHILKHTQSAF